MPGRRGRTSLVAANAHGEAEHWVAVDGPVSVLPTGGFDLAARLAPRYWDVSDPGKAAAVEAWRGEDLVRIAIAADRVRRYG